MTSNNFNVNFIDANAEIQQKVNNYFQSNGLTHKDPDTDIRTWGLGLGYNYNYLVDGSLDDVIVTVAYDNFKPKHIVRREILALDSHIADVRVFRFLDDAACTEQLFEVFYDKFIVMIDGEYQQVTIRDYIYYKSRNVDYSKRK